MEIWSAAQEVLAAARTLDEQISSSSIETLNVAAGTIRCRRLGWQEALIGLQGLLETGTLQEMIQDTTAERADRLENAEQPTWNYLLRVRILVVAELVKEMIIRIGSGRPPVTEVGELDSHQLLAADFSRMVGVLSASVCESF
jgi:hypothetical protein